MDAARLRKTFKYPEETSDSERDELDEQGRIHRPIHDMIKTDIHWAEQEKLISTLRTKEAEQNALYNLIFSILPLTVVVPFLVYLFAGRPKVSLLCLLAITSLLSTAYTMRFVPVNGESTTKRFSPRITELDGPIEKYFAYLNGAIAGLLLLAAWSLRRQSDSPEGLWVFLLLPAVMLVMIMVARKSMSDVEASIVELDGMKYEYKGA
jgi:glucan phosphoethanolaminetransferase (alkaline phosphatase superfamily)